MKNQNIDNLISLWMLAAEPFAAHRKANGINVIELGFTDWPNRVWHNPEDSCDLQNVKDILERSLVKLTFTKWYSLQSDQQQAAIDAGLVLKSVQVGMSLGLQDYTHPQMDPGLELLRVSSEKDTVLWSDVFRQCFSYNISPKLIAQISDRVSFYLVREGNNIVGCVATFIKDNQMGIHSLGILDSYRKNGLAEKLMHVLLIEAKHAGVSSAHLQSSVMGLGIYKRIGFKEFFKMCNYHTRFR